MKRQLIVFVVCLLLGCSTGALATVDPVAHWSFDNPVDLGHDDAGNGHNGTGVGAPASTAGRWGNAVNLDGTSYIDVADATDLNPTSAITVAAWFKVSHFYMGTYSWPPIVKKSDYSQTGGYYLELGYVYEGAPFNSGGVYTDTGWAGFAEPGPSISENLWYFTAITYDGSTYTQYTGTDSGTSLLTNTRIWNGNIISSVNNLNIGHDPSNPYRFFDGAIDEVRIFDRAITSDEVTSLYLNNTIPEPATLLLLGLGGLVLRRGRK